MIPENWAEKPPTPGWGTFFWFQIYPFQAIWSNFLVFGFCGTKAPPTPAWGNIFWLQIYPFQAILSNFGFCGRKAPTPRMRENIFTSDLSISGNFQQLWFLWKKSPPPPLQGWGKIFWHSIYPFQAISSNFGFCGRKAPPPRMRENVLISDLSISGNFQQLWFLWQKSPPSFSAFSSQTRLASHR